MGGAEKRVHPGGDDSLIARPQRLGILPTWSFWHRADVNHSEGAQFVRTNIATGAVLITGIAGGIAGWFPWWAASGVCLGLFTVSLGLVERRIRREVVRRRELTEQREAKLRLIAEPDTGEGG